MNRYHSHVSRQIPHPFRSECKVRKGRERGGRDKGSFFPSPAAFSTCAVSLDLQFGPVRLCVYVSFGGYLEGTCVSRGMKNNYDKMPSHSVYYNTFSQAAGVQLDIMQFRADRSDLIALFYNRQGSLIYTFTCTLLAKP